MVSQNKLMEDMNDFVTQKFDIALTLIKAQNHHLFAK